MSNLKRTLRDAIQDVKASHREYEALSAAYDEAFPSVFSFGEMDLAPVDEAAEAKAACARETARKVWAERSRFARTLRDLMDWDEARAIIDASNVTFN